MIDGIVDLSHWQTDVDFAAYKAGGGQAVILKATQGTGYVDTTFVRRQEAARREGLLVGAYHFCDASRPIEQVSHFLRVAGNIPGVIMALDVEPNSSSGGTVTISQAAEMVTLIKTLSNLLPIVYIGLYGPDGNGTGLPNTILKRCPLWLSQYRTKATCPPGWDDWTLWQWTESGTAPGVKGKCDVNRFSGTEAELHEFWADHSFKEPCCNEAKR